MKKDIIKKSTEILEFGEEICTNKSKNKVARVICKVAAGICAGGTIIFSYINYELSKENKESEIYE